MWGARILLDKCVYCCRVLDHTEEDSKGAMVRQFDFETINRLLTANTRNLIAAEKRWRESTIAEETCGTFFGELARATTRSAPHWWPFTRILEERHREARKIYSWQSFEERHFTAVISKRRLPGRSKSWFAAQRSR